MSIYEIETVNFLNISSIYVFKHNDLFFLFLFVLSTREIDNIFKYIFKIDTIYWFECYSGRSLCWLIEIKLVASHIQIPNERKKPMKFWNSIEITKQKLKLSDIQIRFKVKSIDSIVKNIHAQWAHSYATAIDYFRTVYGKESVANLPNQRKPNNQY